MGKLDFPQGLKPNVYKVLSDTAEAVPFQNRFMKPALTSISWELFRYGFAVVTVPKWDGTMDYCVPRKLALAFTPRRAHTVRVSGDRIRRGHQNPARDSSQAPGC